MIRRTVSLLLLAWALGFAWFALVLPQPAGAARSDVVVALTGGEGRIDRGLETVRRGQAKALFVAGVDPEVRPAEFAAQHHVAPRLLECCVTLDQVSVDTRSNAREAAEWLARRRSRSVRLVTSDWHMRRAGWEFDQAVPAGTTVIRDPVASHPSLRVLFIEYNKLLARRVSDVVGF
ncbi:MAG: YdcF family protein [Rhizorhabdus sp.]